MKPQKSLVGCLLGLTLGAAPLAAQNATIRVDVSKPGPSVSRNLYGLFFEEINRSGDGGIYAEMIQNRSFEDASVPVGWTLLQSPDAKGTMALDKSLPLNANNPTALRLEITSAANGGRVGIVSEGFKGAPYKSRDEDAGKWSAKFETGKQKARTGIVVQEGKSYRATLRARCSEGFTGPLTVSLQTKEGKILATQDFTGLGSAWKALECQLTSSASDRDARLVLSAATPGTLWLDMVSLFPSEVSLQHPFRQDLLAVLKEAKPAFLRFPGGCWIEGNEEKFAYRWKKTIGNIDARPGLWNRWGYYSNDGLGYHEYLQLCEDLNVEGLYVSNCGMGDFGWAGSPALVQEFLQDTLDAIEYAIGPVESPWGKRRAEAGHPAPFPLTLLEIGNENGGPAYVERFEIFRAAISQRYPQLKLIQTSVVARDGKIIDDEHYYRSPEWFMRQAHRYDQRERSSNKVYVGEYAVTQTPVKGNLYSAVGEAAFMTGMERNGDQVIMSSFAPLLECAGWVTWSPNAILFDGAQVYGSPSWHVQSLFGRFRGDENLPLELQCPPATPQEPRSGLLGVGTYNSQADFKDLQVTQGDKVIYSETLTKGTKSLRLHSGTWKVQDQVLSQTATELKNVAALAYLGNKPFGNCTYSLKARKTGGSEGFLIAFNAVHPGQRIWWNLGGWGNGFSNLEGADFDLPRVACKIETGRWYDIRIETSAGHVRCFLDGKLMHEFSDSPLESLYAVAGTRNQDLILKVVNVTDHPQTTQLSLKGAGKLSPTATATVLTSAGANDVNSFEEPLKVAPKTSNVPVAGPEFTYTFAPYSVTILEIKREK